MKCTLAWTLSAVCLYHYTEHCTWLGFLIRDQFGWKAAKMKILLKCCWKVLILCILGCVNCEECFIVDKPSDVPCVFPFTYKVRNLIIQTVWKTNKVINVLSDLLTIILSHGFLFKCSLYDGVSRTAFAKVCKLYFSVKNIM